MLRKNRYYFSERYKILFAPHLHTPKSKGRKGVKKGEKEKLHKSLETMPHDTI